MDSAPMLTTNLGDLSEEYTAYNYLSPGDHTAVLNEQLNSVVDQVPTNRFTQRAVILQYPDVGLYDWNYNVGYHMLPVGNQVSICGHFEAPEIPVTQLPFSQALYNSTLVQEQVNGVLLYNLRSPGINEGF